MLLYNMTCADKIPAQCTDCMLLRQCRELNCIKRTKCKSKRTEPNDISDTMAELSEALKLR